MNISSPQEALFLACEMERRAIHLYQRALVLLREYGRGNEPIYDQLALTLADEQRHFTLFSELYQGLNETVEQELTLSALADGMLFKGGLMRAVREGLISDVPSMLAFAAGEEEKAAAAYRHFATLCVDPRAKETLEAIAREELSHLSDLNAQKAALL